MYISELAFAQSMYTYIYKTRVVSLRIYIYMLSRYSRDTRDAPESLARGGTHPFSGGYHQLHREHTHTHTYIYIYNIQSKIVCWEACRKCVIAKMVHTSTLNQEINAAHERECKPRAAYLAQLKCSSIYVYVRV